MQERIVPRARTPLLLLKMRKCQTQRTNPNVLRFRTSRQFLRKYSVLFQRRDKRPGSRTLVASRFTINYSTQNEPFPAAVFPQKPADDTQRQRRSKSGSALQPILYPSDPSDFVSFSSQSVSLARLRLRETLSTLAPPKHCCCCIPTRPAATPERNNRPAQLGNVCLRGTRLSATPAVPPPESKSLLRPHSPPRTAAGCSRPRRGASRMGISSATPKEWQTMLLTGTCIGRGRGSPVRRRNRDWITALATERPRQRLDIMAAVGVDTTNARRQGACSVRAAIRSRLRSRHNMASTTETAAM